MTGGLSKIVNDYLYKGTEGQVSTLNQAFYNSRGGGALGEWDDFLQKPWFGNGFGVYPDGHFPSGVQTFDGDSDLCPDREGLSAYRDIAGRRCARRGSPDAHHWLVVPAGMAKHGSTLARNVHRVPRHQRWRVRLHVTRRHRYIRLAAADPRHVFIPHGATAAALLPLAASRLRTPIRGSA